MALVDYPSSSDEDVPAPPPRKKQKPSAALPPLPAAFHDLYASKVRLSAVDDPALHDGRRRQAPHVAGHWPSHLYVEWHPSPTQHAALERLVRAAAPDSPVHSFLTSDLGAAQPLHISLSRPLVLPTRAKEAFRGSVAGAVRAAGVEPFVVVPRALAWFHSPDSNRTFLVLHVDEPRAAGAESPGSNGALAALLARFNDVAATYDQPRLYPRSAEGDVDGSAFHVSIAWTLGAAGDGCKGGLVAEARSAELLATAPFAEVLTWKISVDSVKVKIGNVVTSVELGGGRTRGEGFEV